ncbi:metal-dependent hydrolase [Gaetbulibacter aestuarii]|uniref:Metal-dependent hydrolase n=1 Tax=Gaetbulibacter aestuarii TaxID=1502358 RepID=A0ABW7N040_9FLAO
MPSIFGNGMVGYTIAKVSQDKNLKILVVAAVLSAMLPDIDVITFAFGIPYGSPFGHRGFTHSILFALLWALILMYFIGKDQKRLWFFVIFLSTVSHGILDAMTTGGRGVGFLIPFDLTRYFFPLRIIKVSPIGIINFFSEWGFQVVISELKYVFLPCFFIFGLRFFIKTLK